MGLLETIAGGIQSFMDAAPPFLLGLLLLMLVAVPLTLLHELGHAIVAHDRLGTPVLISVGHVGKLAEYRRGGIGVSLNLFSNPLRAGGFAAFDASRATPQDVMWIALGGPMLSLAGFLIALVIYSAAPEAGLVHHIAWAALFDSCFALLNFLPLTLQERRGDSPWRSDGGVALDAARDARAAG